MSESSKHKKLSRFARALKMAFLEFTIQTGRRNKTKKMIRTVRHPIIKGRGIFFLESEVAKRYCRGHGIELGAAAHNPFGLENCVNVAPADDFEFYKEEQARLCGRYADIDLSVGHNAFQLAVMKLTAS